MLTPKQERFVQEFLIDLNSTQAAIRAGYSRRTAKSIGSENLTKPDIQAKISQDRAEQAEAAKISAKWVLDNLIEVSERCMQKTPVMKFDREEKCMRQITDENGEGVWQFDASGANRALELIGKHIGMFVDKHDVTVREGLQELMRKAEERVATAGKREE